MELDLYVRLPADQAGRIAPFFYTSSSLDIGFVFSNAANDPTSSTHNAFSNPRIDTTVVNRLEIWSMEIPGANGIGSAKGLAASYSVAIDGPLRSAVIHVYRQRWSL